jgi:hypothetical protein
MKLLLKILSLSIATILATAAEPPGISPDLHTDQEIVAIAKRHLGKDLSITGTLDDLSKKNVMNITWDGFDRTMAELIKSIGLNPVKMVTIEGLGVNYFYFERLKVSPGYDLVLTFRSGLKRKPDGARPLKLTIAFFIPHKDEKYDMNISQPERWGKIIFGNLEPADDKK